MKNKNLLKVFGIALLTVFLLTWIIPTSTTGTSGIELGAITPTGYADIFTSFEVILTYFARPSIFILMVGMFYGVINKTGSYKAVVDKIVSVFKKKRILFAALTVLIFGTTTVATGIYLPLFMFIPLFIAILLELKYNKLQALLATAGSVILGLISQISSNTYITVTGVKDNTFIWIKLGLAVVLLVLNILYIIKINVKKNKKEEEISESMFVPEKRDTVKGKNPKGIALSLVLVLTFAVFVLGLTYLKDATMFSTLYTNIQNVKIGSFAIFDAILGSFEVFGSWTWVSLYATIGLAIIVIAISNSLTFKETIESSMEGAKKVFGLAVLAALICLIAIFTLNSGFLMTVVNFISKGGNIALVTLSSFIGSPFMVEEIYAAQYIIQLIYSVTANDAMLELYGLIVQVTYGFTMLIAPSSVLLMISLYYLGEGYTKWFKYIWKLLIVVFAACLIAITIATLI